jgi:hypothetical protein
MIATLVIEVSLAVYTLFRYKLSATTRLVVALLLFLALFQLSEFNVCEGYGFSALVWSRIGYAAITMLPPLGLHLVLKLAGKARRWNWLLFLNYLLASGFIVTFVFNSNAFLNHVCAGNYVIFRLAAGYGGLYFLYYYGFLLLGLALSLWFSIMASRRIRQALILQAFGYLSFLFPTAIVNTLNPQTISGIPSIMCGFAVVYAIILACGVGPIAGRKKAKRS